jgi:hypothetical protein
MAQVVLQLEIQLAWWVRPYLRAAAVFAGTIEPFLELDDVRLDEFLERQAQFVASRGVRFYVNGKRI